MSIQSWLLTAIATLGLAACSSEGASDQSALSGHDAGAAGDASHACTLTQGYWKNHPDAWPVASLKLGATSYTRGELIATLETPVKGNGLIQLAHQLIAAKLNVAAGAPDTAVKTAIADADALIGALGVPPTGDGSLATSATSALNDKLDAFNSGNIGPGHCGDDHGEDEGDDDCDDHGCDGGACGHAVCGNGVVEGDEACDDGNTTNGDGCSSTCTVEVCVCGDGVKSPAEQCDDGNTVTGDGCSSTCTIELPVCGNGIIEAGETCDDGNTTSGDGCSSVCICEPCHH